MKRFQKVLNKDVSPHSQEFEGILDVIMTFYLSHMLFYWQLQSINLRIILYLRWTGTLR